MEKTNTLNLARMTFLSRRKLVPHHYQIKRRRMPPNQVNRQKVPPSVELPKIPD